MKPKTVTLFVKLSLRSGDVPKRTRKVQLSSGGDTLKQASRHHGKPRLTWWQKMRNRLRRSNSNATEVKRRTIADDTLLPISAQPVQMGHEDTSTSSDVNASPDLSNATRPPRNDNAEVSQQAQFPLELPYASSVTEESFVEPSPRQQGDRQSGGQGDLRMLQFFPPIFPSRVRPSGIILTSQTSVAWSHGTQTESEWFAQIPSMSNAPSESAVPRLGDKIGRILNASTDARPSSAQHQPVSKFSRASTHRSGSTTMRQIGPDVSDSGRRLTRNLNEIQSEQHSCVRDPGNMRPGTDGRFGSLQVNGTGVQNFANGQTHVVAPRDSSEHKRWASPSGTSCLEDIRAIVLTQRSLMVKMERLEARLQNASDIRMRIDEAPLNSEEQQKQDLRKAYQQAVDDLHKAQLQFDDRDDDRHHDKVENTLLFRESNGAEGLAPEDFDHRWLNMIRELGRDLSKAEKTYRQARLDAIEGGCDLDDGSASSIFDNGKSECYPRKWEAEWITDVDKPGIMAWLAAQPVIIEPVPKPGEINSMDWPEVDSWQDTEPDDDLWESWSAAADCKFRAKISNWRAACTASGKKPSIVQPDQSYIGP